MNLLAETIEWLTDPGHWAGDGSIPVRLGQHIVVTLVVTAIGAVLAIPVGTWMGHHRRGEATVAAFANGARALPTLGIVTGLALSLGIGLQAPLIALVVLAVPSILAGTYSGVASVPQASVDAATALGYTPTQTMLRIELPLAMPVIGGGVQSALVQVVSTATIAAYVADVGLGRYIFSGLKSRDYAEMLGGSALVIILALTLTAAASGVGMIHRPTTSHEGDTP